MQVINIRNVRLPAAHAAERMQEMRENFGSDLQLAAAGRLDEWRGYNKLAAVILQDQFAR